jgi:hypothetical protein
LSKFLEIELRADLQAEPLDPGTKVEVVDHVVASERVPPEDDLRFLGRLEELLLLSRGDSGREQDQEEAGKRKTGNGKRDQPQGPARSFSVFRFPFLDLYVVTLVSAS